MTRLGVLVALLALALGPWYSEPESSWLRHSVSELAAQHTRNAWVMRVGLIALGAGMVLGFLRTRRAVDLPFLFFGVFVALAGVFHHRPFVDGRPFSEREDLWHSVFSTLTGLSAMLGMLVRALTKGDAQGRSFYMVLAIAYVLLPILMDLQPQLSGLYQRVIFGSFFVWAWIDYPTPRDQ